MAPRKWPSFPFQISTNHVRDRLSGIAIVEIFQPPVEPQTKERERKEGKRKRRYTPDLLRKRSTFQSACGSFSIDIVGYPLVKQRKFVGAQIYRASAILIDTSKVFPCQEHQRRPS